MAKITFETNYSDAMLAWLGELTEEKCLKHNSDAIKSIPTLIHAIDQSITKLSQLASKYNESKEYYNDIKQRLAAVKSRNKGQMYDQQYDCIIIRKDGVISNEDQITEIDILNKKLLQKRKMLDEYFADLIMEVDAKASNAMSESIVVRNEAEKPKTKELEKYIRVKKYSDTIKELKNLVERKEYSKIGEYISKNKASFYPFTIGGEHSVTNFIKILIPESQNKRSITNSVSMGYKNAENAENVEKC